MVNSESIRRIGLGLLFMLCIITIVSIFTLNVVALNENLTVTSDTDTVYVGQPKDVLITVTCNVSDNCNSGDPVESADVTLNGKGFNYNDVTDNSGKLSVKINASSTGSITVNAKKDSDTGSTSIFAVRENATTILPQLVISAQPNSLFSDVSTVVSFHVETGCPTGAVSCNAGSPVPNAAIHVIGEGSLNTDSNGDAIMTITPSNLGTITAKVSANGYTNGSTTISVLGTNSPIQLSISTNNSGVYVGVPENVTYTVTRPCGTIPGEICGVVGTPVPVDNASITISGVASGEGTTNSNGKDMIVVNANSPGFVTAVVNKPGYISSSTNLNANMAIDFAASKDRFYKGEIVNLIFSNSGGVPIQLGNWYIMNSTSGNIVHTSSPMGGNLDGGQNLTLNWDQTNNSDINNTICDPGPYTGVADYSFNGVSYTLSTNFSLSRCTRIVNDPQQISSVVGQDVNFPIDLTNSSNTSNISRKWNYTTWYINGVEALNLTGLKTVASYLNDSAYPGTYNVVASAVDGCSAINWSWSWIVDKPPCINVQNYRNMSTFAGDPAVFTTGNLSSVSNSWNFSWYVNNVSVFNETGVSQSNYTGKGVAGNSNITAVATYDCNQVSWTWAWSVTKKPSTGGSSAGGGGGGGGGGSGGGGGGIVSAEPFSNILKFERQDADLVGGAPVPYTFQTPEFSIYQVLITGESNQGAVGMRIEHLKNTSALVSRLPPGTIFANENVWLESKRINGILIRFKVNNAWIVANNIAKENVQLLRFNNGWKRLPTNITKSDNNFTYFEAKSSGLSSFAVSGFTQTDLGMPSVDNTTNISNVGGITDTPRVTANPVKKTPGVGILLIVGVISAIYIMRRVKIRFK